MSAERKQVAMKAKANPITTGAYPKAWPVSLATTLENQRVNPTMAIWKISHMGGL